MAEMPPGLRFTAAEVEELRRIQKNAKRRHEVTRLAAEASGRHDFPLLPRECSWSYEEEFRRKVRARR